MQPYCAKSVSIVTPVYNECGVIEDVIRSVDREILQYLKDFEFIVAEDGSSDGTRQILRKLEKEIPIRLVCSEKRKGYAKALKDALSLAKNEIVFFLDSDGQHQVADFWKLLPFIDDFDLVTGYKCPRHDGKFRLFISRVMNSLVFFMFGCFFRDINSGFKLFRKPSLDILLESCEGMDFISIELLLKAFLRKMAIAEVPVIHFQRKFGESRGLPAAKLPIKALGLLADLIRMKLRLFFLQKGAVNIK